MTKVDIAKKESFHMLDAVQKLEVKNFDIAEILLLSEASQIWLIESSTIRKSIQSRQNIVDILIEKGHLRKSLSLSGKDGVYLISIEAMETLFGSMPLSCDVDSIPMRTEDDCIMYHISELKSLFGISSRSLSKRFKLQPELFTKLVNTEHLYMTNFEDLSITKKGLSFLYRI